MANYHDEILNFEKIAKEHTEYMRNSINLIASENVLLILLIDMLKDKHLRGFTKDANMWI